MQFLFKFSPVIAYAILTNSLDGTSFCDGGEVNAPTDAEAPSCDFASNSKSSNSFVEEEKKSKKEYGLLIKVGIGLAVYVTVVVTVAAAGESLRSASLSFPLFRTHIMKTLIASGIAAVALVSSASADVTFTFTNQTWTGFNFTEAFAAGTLTGNLRGVTVNATLNASTNYTYADDLCVYVAPAPLALGGLLQCGGFSNLNAGQRYSWANGASNAPGTPVTGTVNFTTSIDMGRSPTQIIWVGNGYGAAGTSGTFTGTITLLGVTAIPAPGAVALLGLAGFCSRRRRA